MGTFQLHLDEAESGNHASYAGQWGRGPPSDWIARLEKSEKELTEQLQVIDKGVTNFYVSSVEDVAAIASFWADGHGARRAGGRDGRDGTYDYEKVTQYFMNKYIPNRCHG